MKSIVSKLIKISNYIDLKWGWFLTNGMKQEARTARLRKKYGNEKV